MATYKQIQEYIRNNYNVTVQTCWIAHVKEMCGLNPRQAPNRLSATERQKPCPEENIELIKEALRHLNMIN